MTRHWVCKQAYCARCGRHRAGASWPSLPCYKPLRASHPTKPSLPPTAWRSLCTSTSCCTCWTAPPLCAPGQPCKPLPRTAWREACTGTCVELFDMPRRAMAPPSWEVVEVPPQLECATVLSFFQARWRGRRVQGAECCCWEPVGVPPAAANHSPCSAGSAATCRRASCP